MAFLQIVTRTFGKRPVQLKRNRDSLEALADPDWEQTIVVDEVGRGCAWANANLGNVPATGEYVWVLDDDDVCCLKTLVRELKEAATKYAQVIVMSIWHEEFGLLPSEDNWEEAPVLGNCGFSNFFVRADIWERYRFKLFDCECYEGDYRFFNYLWLKQVNFCWHDALAAYMPQRSIGKVE